MISIDVKHSIIFLLIAGKKTIRRWCFFISIYSATGEYVDSPSNDVKQSNENYVFSSVKSEQMPKSKHLTFKIVNFSKRIDFLIRFDFIYLDSLCNETNFGKIPISKHKTKWTRKWIEQLFENVLRATTPANFRNHLILNSA